MKIFYRLHQIVKQLPLSLVMLLLVIGQNVYAQPATINNPLAIGQNCGGGGNNFKSFNYDSTARKLTQIGSNCNPSLQTPGFNPGGGSIAFSPKDQKVYYIETTTGNNSIVWSWTPGTCPVFNQAPIYTYSSTFIVGLEFNTLTGDGYQLEFSTGASPYNIYLRKVTSFGPPLVAGAPVQIVLPGGKQIYQQNGDIAITPTGKMYFILDNKMFSLDYSTYGSGFLNANYIDTIKNGAGNNVIGLSYSDDKFIASVSNSGSTCFYDQIDIASGAAVVKPITLASGTFIAYDMATMVTGIGAAKRLTSLSKTGALTYTAEYDIKVKNYGNVNLNAVQLTDDIKSAFGSGVFVSATAAAVGSLPTGVTLNAAYNGNSVTSLFTTGSTMKASPADSVTVRVTVKLNNPNLSTTYYNSAIATATGAIFVNSVRDSSDNQALLDPDVSGTDVPDLKGQGVPTPITPAAWLLLDNDVINFNATRNADIVNLRWTLDNQQPGVTTTLQRSADGTNFENIAVIKSQPLSRQDYTWQDAHLLNDNNYYRLLVTSPGNKKTYSSIVLIRKTDQDVTLSVMPNPFMQSLKFTLKLDRPTKISYRILDYVSKALVAGSADGFAGQNEIEVQNPELIPAGPCILEVFAGDKHFFKKIIKLK